MDTLSHTFLLMGTLLEIVLVGSSPEQLDSLAWWMLRDGQIVVREVSALYLRPLQDETLLVSSRVDTLLRLGLHIARKTGDTVTPFYRTPACHARPVEPGRWFFQGSCRWDPSAYLKGWMVDRWVEGLPPDVRSAYVAFGGSSIRVRGAWPVWTGRSLRVVTNSALGISASHKRGDRAPHLFAGGRPLAGTVHVVVEAPTALEADVEATWKAIRVLSAREEDLLQENPLQHQE